MYVLVQMICKPAKCSAIFYAALSMWNTWLFLYLVWVTRRSTGQYVSLHLSASCRWLPQGVPYAAPPVGPLRFQKPQDPAPWTGVRCCRGPAPQAVQSFSLSFRPFVPWRLLGDLLTGIVWLMGRDPRANTNIHKPQKVPKHMSEDCLYLDVELPLPLPTREEGDG